MKEVSIFLNSKNRTSGSTSNFNARLIKGLKNVHRIQLRSVEVPISYYTVNSTNNTLKFSNQVPTEFTVTFSEGNYSAIELAAEIETKMKVVSSNMTVVFNDNTLKFTFANNGNDFRLFDSVTTCQSLIGLENDTGTVTTYTSTKIVNISGPNHLYILSSELTSGRDMAIVDNDYREIAFRVPIKEVFGSINNYEPTSAQYLNYNTDHLLQQIDLKIVDEEFNEMNFNGLEWNIELLVFMKQD
jgi:hypothetical protein